MFGSLFSQKPVQLTDLATPRASDLVAKFKPSPEGRALLQTGQSSSDYINSLQQNKQPMDALNALAHAMRERDAVFWACQSAEQVADKLNGPDRAALAAAQAWLGNPAPDTRAAAAKAATKTDFSGPGAWAAQAAAWAKVPGAPAPADLGKVAPAAPAGSSAPSLAASAVAGSVLLAAGLVKRPAMPEPTPPRPQIPGVQKPAVPAPALQQPSLPQPAAPQLPSVSAPAVAVPGAPAVPGFTAPVLPAAGSLTLSTMPQLSAPKPAMPTIQPPAAPAFQQPALQPPAFQKPALPQPGAPKPPPAAPDQAKLLKMLNPFIDLGKDIASGKNPPA
jgi:hypothetical protein